MKSEIEPKQIHHSNHQRSPIAIGLLKKGKYANGQRLTQLIQAVASQEDPQNLDTHRYDWRYYSDPQPGFLFVPTYHTCILYNYMWRSDGNKRYADMLLLQIYTVDREGAQHRNWAMSCTIESLDANILRIVCLTVTTQRQPWGLASPVIWAEGDCSDVGAEESNVHIKRSHHDIVLLGLQINSMKMQVIQLYSSKISTPVSETAMDPHLFHQAQVLVWTICSKNHQPGQSLATCTVKSLLKMLAYSGKSQGSVFSCAADLWRSLDP